MSITDVNEKHPVCLIHLIEDDEYYISLAKQILATHELTKTREFYSLIEYKEFLKEEPTLIVNIALLDYRFPTGDLTGMDIAKQLFERCKRKRNKTKTIMITGYEIPRKEERRFFNKYHGYGMLDKNDPDFEQDYKDMLQEAVQEIIETYQDMVFYTEMKEELKPRPLMREAGT